MTNTLTPDDLGRIATKAWIEFMLETSIVKDRSTLGDYDNGDEGFKTLMRGIGLAVAEAVGKQGDAEHDELREQLRLSQQAYLTVANAAGVPEFGPEALAALIGATQMVYSQTDRQYKLAAQQRDKLREAMDALRAEAEEHRARYDAKRSDTFHMPDQQYWGGRRDEAGHFRDKLTKILEAPK